MHDTSVMMPWREILLLFQKKEDLGMLLTCELVISKAPLEHKVFILLQREVGQIYLYHLSFYSSSP